jgi:hypothetical protein
MELLGVGGDFGFEGLALFDALAREMFALSNVVRITVKELGNARGNWEGRRGGRKERHEKEKLKREWVRIEYLRKKREEWRWKKEKEREWWEINMGKGRERMRGERERKEVGGKIGDIEK